MTYITIAPSRPRGKYLVAGKAINNYYIVAECPSEVAAQQIRDALNDELTARRSVARAA